MTRWSKLQNKGHFREARHLIDCMASRTSDEYVPLTILRLFLPKLFFHFRARAKTYWLPKRFPFQRFLLSISPRSKKYLFRGNLISEHHVPIFSAWGGVWRQWGELKMWNNECLCLCSESILERIENI